MPNRDNPRGPWRDDERDRWRQDRERETMRGRGEWQGGERRAFDERGQEPWRRDRYAARYDQDRAGYGEQQDAGAPGYRAQGERGDTARFGDVASPQGGEPYGYAGQEYGLEGHPGVSGGGSGWGFDRKAQGAGQDPAAYGRQTPSHPDREFDPEYLHWREEQMRAHDRDYQDWRREQHRRYDDQYRQYRSERQRHFGEAFHQWRSQRGMVGGVPDTSIGSVGQGQGGYGDKTGIPGGYNAASAYDRPTGYLDPPGHLTADPAMQQVGGGAGGQDASAPPTGDRTPEFGREPPQVQTTADGGVQGHERRRHEEKEQEAAKGEEAKRH
jgi:hypothetical protein